MTDQENKDLEEAEKYSFVADGIESFPGNEYNEALQKAFLAGIAHRDKNPSDEVRELIDLLKDIEPSMLPVGHRSKRQKALQKFEVKS